MDPNKLEKQKDYFRICYGHLQILTYIDYEAEWNWFLFWARGSQPIQGCRYSHSLNQEGVRNEIQELSNSFKEFILLFQ